jgi:hypothetical protein
VMHSKSSSLRLASLHNRHILFLSSLPSRIHTHTFNNENYKNNPWLIECIELHPKKRSIFKLLFTCILSWLWCKFLVLFKFLTLKRWNRMQNRSLYMVLDYHRVSC